MRKMQQWFQQLVNGSIKTRDQLSAAVAREAVQRDALGQSFERFGGEYQDKVKDLSPSKLVMPSMLSSAGTLRQHDRADWQNTDPRLRLWAARFIESARRRGIPLYVHSAFRTKAEQNALVVQGVSKAKWPQAPHAKGFAVDVVHSAYHWDMTESEWAFLGKLGYDALARLNAYYPKEQKLQLEWGGTWRFYDPAHWEVVGWRHGPVPSAGPPVRKTPRWIIANERPDSIPSGSQR